MWISSEWGPRGWHQYELYRTKHIHSQSPDAGVRCGTRSCFSVIQKVRLVFFTREGVNKLWSLCKVSLRQCEANRVAEFAGVCNTKSREVEQSMFSAFTSYTNSHTVPHCLYHSVFQFLNLIGQRLQVCFNPLFIVHYWFQRELNGGCSIYPDLKKKKNYLIAETVRECLFSIFRKESPVSMLYTVIYVLAAGQAAYLS